MLRVICWRCIGASFPMERHSARSAASISACLPSPRNLINSPKPKNDERLAGQVARTRNGFTPASREQLYKRFRGLELADCPFVNLPEAKSGRWGQGLTAEKMQECRWLKPQLVGQFEFVEWTPDDHLRHSRFIGLREDKNAREVRREN